MLANPIENHVYLLKFYKQFSKCLFFSIIFPNFKDKSKYREKLKVAFWYPKLMYAKRGTQQ